MNDPKTATPFISAGLKGFLQRRMEEIFGLICLGLGGVVLAMIVSYDPADPSSHTISSISTGEISNLLGVVGAEIAAHLVAAMGQPAAIALGIAFLIWGIRLIRHARPERMRRRFLVLPVALCLLSFSASAWLGESYGGAIGRMLVAPLLTMPELNLSLPEPLEMIKYGHLLMAALTGLGLVVYLYAAAIDRGEMRLVSRLLGLMRQGMLYPVRSLKALAARFWQESRTPKDSSAKRRQKPKPRREPVVVTQESAEDDTPSLTAARRRKPRGNSGQGSLDLENASGYRLPSLNLLAPPNKALAGPDKDVLDTNSRMLESVLAEFGVRGEIEKARFGPVVTRYELSPAPGTKTQRVIGLADDIARSMSALSVRVAVVPGQNVIGIELPNTDRQTVLIRDIFDGDRWSEQSASLPMALGMDIAGHPVIADLARMPHLLVAGTTGSGKSVGINGMILSLLYTHTPETCRLIMIDPKMLELSVYDGIPHLLTPVVTDPGKAVTALKWTVREMETRYRNMSKLGVRNIDGYNKRLEEARRKGETLTRRVQTGFDAETGKPVFEEQELDLNPLPFIVVIIDEVADLMLVAGKDIEAAVQRLAQMARAAGIHVVMATQRPSVDVITGTIKANFPTRISFQVTSKIDSRTILGEQGAEQLLGKGDMLYMEGGGRIVRVHGPFVNDGEVEKVANFLRQQGEPVYDDSVTEEVDADAPLSAMGGLPEDNGDAGLYDQAVQLVAREGKASTSFIQRHLRIGYNRAATIIEEMERRGVVSAANHAGKREVLIDARD
ncbi:DNA translocase FtsK 4TM domain-containing protein [Alphaproteobacteria bacterium LSUCC0684]